MEGRRRIDDQLIRKVTINLDSKEKESPLSVCAVIARSAEGER